MYTKIDAWRCSDGTVHTSENLAKYREEEIERSQRANEALEAGKSLADCLRLYGTKEPAAVFDQMTRDTPLVISHWQCMDTPGYKVCRFEPEGIFVHGHAGSAWGPYGAMVDYSDLRRYAEGTFKRQAPRVDATHE